MSSRNVGIIFSETSRQAFVERAVREGQVYRFRGSRGKVNWIAGEAYLAVNGLASVLRRIGVRFDILEEGDCASGDLMGYRTIFCPNACKLTDGAISGLFEWLKGPRRRLVVSGHSNMRIARLERFGKIVHIASTMFEQIGEILQGHSSVEHIRLWMGDRTDFYVDEMAYHIKSLLLSRGCELETASPWGEYDNVLVLRHDTDFSRDCSYLEYEVANGIPATYAVLADRNRRFHLSNIRPHSFLEVAYHYTSVKRGVKPDKKGITGVGLAAQAEKGSRNYGIPCVTLHKHGNAFYYPETVEAIDYVYEKYHRAIGMGTMFRFNNMRYSGDRAMSNSYTVKHPDVSVPFWFPFHMVMPTVERHKVLRGWDCTHFIEPSPGQLDMMFKNAERLPYGVYMVGYHPAHARADTFNPGGNYKWFLYAVEGARKRGWLIANYRTVCQMLNNMERNRG